MSFDYGSWRIGQRRSKKQARCGEHARVERGRSASLGRHASQRRVFDWNTHIHSGYAHSTCVYQVICALIR